MLSKSVVFTYGIACWFFSFFILSPAALHAQIYEAEQGMLSGGANVQACGDCSGTAMAGNLGGNTNGTLTLKTDLARAGFYKMTLFYCTADPRTVHVTPNGGGGISVHCPPSGGWTTVGRIVLTLYLNAGNNVIRFDNNNGWGPNLDKIILASFSSTDVKTIPFGNEGGHIDYDLNNGTYDVYFHHKQVIKNAFAYCLSDSAYNSMLGYTKRDYSSSPVADSLGTGTKHVITLSGGGQPDMQQVFYTYPDKHYFFTAVLLRNEPAGCRRMSPLTSHSVDLQLEAGDNRALFVPFDNDMWVRYDAKVMRTADFTSSEVAGLYNNDSRKGLVIGSVEHENWKTGIGVAGSGNGNLSLLSVVAGWTDAGITHDKLPHGSVGVGKAVCRSPEIMVNYCRDWRDGFDEYAVANTKAEPRYIFTWTGAVPFGWNSWGKIQTSLSLDKAKAVVDFFADDCPAFRDGDSSLYIDLDSYWDNLSAAQLKQFVAYCKSKGFKPGIYWGPFTDWGKHNRQVEGSAYDYKSCWTKVNGAPFELDGAYAMDPTHPGTKARIRYFIDKFRDCGFEMIKIDFLTHGAIEADSFYDPAVHTGMQAFREGMEYLADQLDGKMLVYAAISPGIATGRYAHMRRIACDAFKNINETAYTLNSTSYGWWLRHIYDYIDADHVVFDNASMGENRARLASAIVTGTLITGDDFSARGSWTSKARDLLQNPDLLRLARQKRDFRPVEGNTGSDAAELFETTIGDRLYLAVFNYGSKAKTYRVDLARLGLAAARTYPVKELFRGDTLRVAGAWSFTLPAADAAIFSFELHQREDPAGVVSFTVKKKGYTSRLDWSTAPGARDKPFIIERSADGKRFDSIGLVQGRPGTDQPNDYGFDDPYPLNGVNYYRLKRTSADGDRGYSNILSLSFDQGNDLVLYPNPSHDKFNIRLPAPAGGNMIVKIINAAGRTVQAKDVNKQGGNIIPVKNISHLPSGVYFVVVQMAGGRVGKGKLFKD